MSWELIFIISTATFAVACTISAFWQHRHDIANALVGPDAE
jgi:hypothetical protein